VLEKFYQYIDGLYTNFDGLLSMPVVRNSGEYYQFTIEARCYYCVVIEGKKFVDASRHTPLTSSCVNREMALV